MRTHISLLVAGITLVATASAFQSPIQKAPACPTLGNSKWKAGFAPRPSLGRRDSLSLKSSQLPFIAARTALHQNPTFVLTAICCLSTFGISLEQRTTIGKALSAPLATMALSLIVANVGIIPFSSPVYTSVNKFLVPLAVPMLLFDSDLQRVIRDSGSLLLAFGVGALATTLATIIAYPLVPIMGDLGWRLACALAARHIGGAINFVAVAETLNIPGWAVSAAIAADNVVVALYFMFLFAISSSDEDDTTEVVTADTLEDDDSEITLSGLAMSLSVASCLVSLGQLVTKLCLPSGTSALPMTSILTVVAATVAPRFFSRIRSSGTAIGILMIQMFFAASGAGGSIQLVLQKSPSLAVFSALQIALHFAFLMGIGKFICRLPNRDLYLASNANVGGPTTAAAMAQAKNWKRLVLPALLIGILGYATGTAIALGLGPILLRIKG